jgi:hypothetical protein
MLPADSPATSEPFFLIIADYNRRVFSVEGPMTDDRAWIAAAREVRDRERQRVVCGPRGTDPASLAAEYRGLENMAGVPPGSIVRPKR